MGLYKQLKYDIEDLIEVLPNDFKKIPLHILSYALEIQELLKYKGAGMTEDEVKEAGDNYFSSEKLKELEKYNVITTGYVTTKVDFQKGETKNISLNELRYFLTSQEEEEK